MLLLNLTTPVSRISDKMTSPVVYARAGRRSSAIVARVYHARQTGCLAESNACIPTYPYSSALMVSLSNAPPKPSLEEQHEISSVHHRGANRDLRVDEIGRHPYYARERSVLCPRISLAGFERQQSSLLRDRMRRASDWSTTRRGREYTCHVGVNRAGGGRVRVDRAEETYRLLPSELSW